MPAYEDKPPFDSSLMVYFRKRLTPEIIGEINEMIISKAKDRDEPPPPPTDNGGDEEDEPENEGDLIVDATCAPQNIRYPQDLSLLTVEDRIVSLGQPWVRPIVRGKAKAKCEFGAKLDVSVSNGFVRLEHTSFDAYNESGNLIGIIERYRQREGHYPERVLVDGIYRNRGNLAFCKKKGIRLMGKPLGRPKKDAVPDRKQMRTDEIDRIEAERQLSHAKGSFGLGLIRTKLKATSETVIALSIVALNLHHIGRIFVRIIGICFQFTYLAYVQRKLLLFSRH